jgi:hypothetical protein
MTSPAVISADTGCTSAKRQRISARIKLAMRSIVRNFCVAVGREWSEERARERGQCSQQTNRRKRKRKTNDGVSEVVHHIIRISKPTPHLQTKWNQADESGRVYTRQWP